MHIAIVGKNEKFQTRCTIRQLIGHTDQTNTHEHSTTKNFWVEVMQRLLISCKSLDIIKLLNPDTATTLKWDKLEKKHLQMQWKGHGNIVNLWIWSLNWSLEQYE